MRGTVWAVLTMSACGAGFGCGEVAAPAVDDISTMSRDEWDRHVVLNHCVPIASDRPEADAFKCADGRVIYWGHGI
jgi:hypothetical protein